MSNFQKHDRDLEQVKRFNGIERVDDLDNIIIKMMHNYQELEIDFLLMLGYIMKLGYDLKNIKFIQMETYE